LKTLRVIHIDLNDRRWRRTFNRKISEMKVIKIELINFLQTCFISANYNDDNNNTGATCLVTQVP